MGVRPPRCNGFCVVHCTHWSHPHKSVLHHLFLAAQRRISIVRFHFHSGNKGEKRRISFTLNMIDAVFDKNTRVTINNTPRI